MQLTLASSPFSPCTVVNSTSCPCSRALKPLAFILLKLEKKGKK